MQYGKEDTLEHILYLAKQLRGFEPAQIIKLLLLELNFYSNSTGWSYLCEAIHLYQSEHPQCVTKELYPVVARHCGHGVKSWQVEKAIRSAICKAWEQRDDKIWVRYFPASSNGTVNRPSNSEFISRIAATVDFWSACCQLYEHPNQQEDIQ